jgi:Ca2+/Na+ antiporter
VSSLAALALLVAGVALVVVGADLFFRGLLALAARLRLPAFVVTVVLSGFELENLDAGIAANAKGLPGAAAGTFLGGTVFLATAVAGLGALIAPMRARIPASALLWTARGLHPREVLSALLARRRHPRRRALRWLQPHRRLGAAAAGHRHRPEPAAAVT